MASPGPSTAASAPSRSRSTTASGRRRRLGPDVGIDYWRQWYFEWDAKPGLHRIAVRATDLKGQAQITERATPFPSGSSGIQEVVVSVA